MIARVWQHKGLVTTQFKERRETGVHNMENDISGSVFLEELTLKCFPELVESLKKDIPRSLMVISFSPDVTSRQ